jgi:autotransporter adhesin
MATAQLAVSLLPAAQVHTEAEKADIVVRQAEDLGERGQALSAATAAGEKRVDTLHADDRVMAVVVRTVAVRTVADTPVAEGISP